MVHLVSNIPHYHYAAEALFEEGLLSTYCTSWTLLGDEEPPRVFPEFYRRKLQGRRLKSVTKDRVSRLYSPEFLQKALPKTGLFSSAFSTDLNNWLFDQLACGQMERARVLHFVNTLGVASAQKFRRQGGYVICDSRQEHPLTQDALLSNEAARRGLRGGVSHGRLTDRMLEEFRHSDHFLVPSSYAQRTFVENGITPDRITVLPYGVDQSLFRPGRKASGGPFTLLFVGTLGLRKGILYLLEAVRRLKTTALRLLCIGNAEVAIEPLLQPYRNLFTHIQNVPKIQLHEYYGIADAFVLPSLSDAYPLVILEAVMSGLPVITTSNAGSCDLLVDGKSGFVVPPADPEALASAIGHLLESKKLTAEMSNFNARLSSKIGWDAYKASLIGFYRNDVLPRVAA